MNSYHQDFDCQNLLEQCTSHMYCSRHLMLSACNSSANWNYQSTSNNCNTI